MTTAVSKEAIDLIIAEEVSSEAVYRRKYTGAEWPGVKSGVTIGIGYDVGYHTPQDLRRDWGGRIPQSTINALSRACGVTGPAAKPLAARLNRVINIPWEAALAEFIEVEVPRWVAKVRKALPNTDKLHPDCLGVLVSLTYNRGPSYNMASDRYREMRAIKWHMQHEDFWKIPDELRAMKRLWPNVRGLLARRDREAALFARGLKKALPPVPPVVPPPPPTDPLDEDVYDTRPRIESKTNITGVMGFLMAVWGAIESAAGDWRFWLFILLALGLAYVVWERNNKPDLSGWLPDWIRS